MAQAGPGPGRVAVKQDPDRVRVPRDDVQFAGAQQWHVAQTELASRQRRERATQVLGRGEDDRHQLIVLHGIALQQQGQQLPGPLDHGLRGVVVHRGRPPQRHQTLVAHRPAPSLVAWSGARPRPVTAASVASTPGPTGNCSIDKALYRHIAKSISRFIVLLSYRDSGSPLGAAAGTPRERPPTRVPSSMRRRPEPATTLTRTGRAKPSYSSTPVRRRPGASAGSHSTSAR